MLKGTMLIDSQAQLNALLVVPCDEVFLDGRPVCFTIVFGSRGAGKMPLDVACASDERYIVQINQLWRVREPLALGGHGPVVP